jgi:multidrug efflux pump subunit AcrB
MHADVVPELASGPVLEVQTEALGLSGKEVEQYVTVPLENNLLDGIMGVWDVRSNSVPGLSSVDLYFEPGTTVLHARQLVQERLTNAFSLPNVSKPPLLIGPLSTSSRVLMIGLTSKSLSGIELSYLARWIVKPRLSGVPGVANVAIFGQQDRQLQVLVDPSALAARGITLQQIIDTAGNSQLVSPLSYLEGAAPGTGGFLDGPNQRLEIRPLLPLGTPRDLAQVPIAGAPGRQPLGGVTTVVEDHQPLIGNGFVGSSPGLVLMIQKLPSASVLGVTTGVERALDELRPALPGVTINSSFFRPATYVSSGLHHMALAGAIGGGLALLLLLAVLGVARAAVVGLVSVTVSLLSALLLLDALGYTLTPLVILGLLVASVVVVDDAVGAAYEIVRRVRARGAGDGESIGTLVLDACATLRSPLGYATLIVLLSAAPVFFTKGLTATFVHPMLLAFTLAVLTSALVALTVTPALGMLLFDRGRCRPRDTRIARAAHGVYAAALERALRLPRPALLAVCVLGLAGIAVLPFLRAPAAPSFQDRNVVVAWNGPPGTSLGEMDRITARVLGQLRDLPAVGAVGATLGRAVSADQIVDTSSGQLYVALRPSADYDQALASVQQVVGSVPGMQASVGTYESDVMSGVLAPATHSVDVRVYGEDYAVLGALARQVGAVMSRIGGLGRPQIRMPVQEPNIEVAINDSAALRAGVLPGDARREASTLVSGLAVGNFFEDQAVFDVVVRGAPAVGSNLSAIENMLIDTSGGGHVRLGDIATVSVRPDPVDIQRQAVSRYVDVSANLPGGGGGGAAAVRSALRSRLAGIAYPLEYHAEIQGGSPDDPTSHGVLVSYILAAAIGIFLLLQAAFGSWRLALLLFSVIPVGALGGVVVAVAGGQAESLAAYAGLLGALAFSARQAMMLADRVRRLQAAAGAPVSRELVARAGADRFGPALGAATVAAAALLPFALLGDTAGNELTHTAAAVMLGGLLTSVLSNLLILPAVQLAFGPAAPIGAPEPAGAAGWAPDSQPMGVG